MRTCCNKRSARARSRRTLTTPANHKRLVASRAIAIQTTIFLPFARMRIGLHVMDIHLSLLDDGVMDLLAVLSCSLLPISYRAFIQSVRVNNGLDWTSIGKQYHHDHHQFRWRA